MDHQPIERSAPAKLLTIDEVAALLQVPKSWIYERTRHGTIPHLKLGKYLRFPTAELHEWMARHEKGNAQARRQ
jgi:excisionase family DNA binding protein